MNRRDLTPNEIDAQNRAEARAEARKITAQKDAAAARAKARRRAQATKILNPRKDRPEEIVKDIMTDSLFVALFMGLMNFIMLISRRAAVYTVNTLGGIREPVETVQPVARPAPTPAPKQTFTPPTSSGPVAQPAPVPALTAAELDGRARFGDEKVWSYVAAKLLDFRPGIMLRHKSAASILTKAEPIIGKFLFHNDLSELDPIYCALRKELRIAKSKGGRGEEVAFAMRQQIHEQAGRWLLMNDAAVALASLDEPIGGGAGNPRPGKRTSPAPTPSSDPTIPTPRKR